jgi:hypothetical protein
MVESCPNCGIELSDTPEEDGLHPVHHPEYAEDGEEYCSACAFQAPDHGSYKETGDIISRAAELDADDEELVEMLKSIMNVPELRRFMSTFGMSRSRGANKHESAVQAVEQNRARCAYQVVRSMEAPGGFEVSCPNCGLEEHHGDEEAAAEAAREHKSENPQHWPRAIDTESDERLYG